MWKMKCMTKPVIIGATRVATKRLKKTSQAIPGKYSIDSLQKTAKLEHHTHNMESTAVNLKSEWWGLLVVKVLGRKGL
jgi:hypothetical protein